MQFAGHAFEGESPQGQLWTELEPGVHYSVLSVRADSGVTMLTRVAAGTIGGWHEHPRVWASGCRGERLCDGLLATDEGFATAEAIAVAAVLRCLDRKPEAGSHIPSQIFGADWLDGVGGLQRRVRLV